MQADDQPIQIVDATTLSDDWHVLKKYTFDLHRKNGTWQRQNREVYDTGGGATVLLYNREYRTVILTRQFRLPAYLDGLADGMLIEAPAGMLENETPDDRIRDEIEEETGYCVNQVTKAFEAYMSPGSVKERLFFFIAEYQPDKRKDAGGGVESEGEDIEVLEVPFDKACEMMEKGEIMDAKTIMLLQYAALRLFNKQDP
jgi:nudix-type nucleoside diphosphatase (YffH/AdpP family)